MFHVLTKLIEQAHKYEAYDLAKVVLSDPRFLIWSGAPKQEMHHYGKHGLLVHTNEVIDLCLLNNSYFPTEKRVNERDLYLAALFHDAGKMWDYEPLDANGLSWHGTQHKRRIHHISRSGILWASVSGDLESSEDILHAILAHHGQREWGSPVAPATRLAWLLHFCDGISARMDDCVKFDRLGLHV